MSTSLRQVRRRIKSVEETKKMTHAMEMVAAAKLKRLQDLLARSDRYVAELARILQTLVREKSLAHPLLARRAEVKSVLVFLITSDTGLCGSYNSNVTECANQFLSPLLSSPPFAGGGKRRRDDLSIQFVSLGRNGAVYLKRKGQTILKELPIPRPQHVDGTIEEMTKIATESFIHQVADEVDFVYTQVRSLASLKPMVGRLFPIEVDRLEEHHAPYLSSSPRHDSWRGEDRRGDAPVDYILEPDLAQVLEIILPQYVKLTIAQFVKHSLVAEQASRMMAMRQATDNAKKMIDSLTLLRNKVRQATITKELIEVVSGSRAQKER